MKPIKFCILLLLLLPAVMQSGPASAASRMPPPEEIDSLLLVGNSFTFYNNGVHNHLKALLKSAQPDEKSRHRLKSLTLSGGALADHTAGLEQTLSNGDWDIVLLQGHSLEAIDPKRSKGFRAAAAELAETARRHQATPVLFMTWAYTSQPEMSARLDLAYTAAGREINAAVAPVGLAFALARQELSSVELIMDDDKHPTLAGTYLASCAIYATLFQRSPLGLDYRAGLNKKTAAQLQNLAYQAVMSYQERD